MGTLNGIFRKIQVLSQNIQGLLKCSTYYDYDDLSGLEINFQDSDELQLWNELRIVMDKLAEVQERVDFLSRPIKAIGTLHKNASGRYETEQGYEFSCGSVIEAYVDDGYHDVPYWVRTRIEAENEEYYLYGFKLQPLEGLTVRVREAEIQWQ